MNKAVKGTLYFSTGSDFSVKVNKRINLSFKDEIIKDLLKAAEETEFKNIDGSNIEFIFNNKKEGENNVTTNEFNFYMKNFSGVKFTDSFKDAPIERQELFKTWSKFWSHLSKLGYKIK